MNYPKALTTGLSIQNQHFQRPAHQFTGTYHSVPSQQSVFIPPSFNTRTVQAKANSLNNQHIAYQNQVGHQNKATINPPLIKSTTNIPRVHYQRPKGGTHSAGSYENHLLHQQRTNAVHTQLIHGHNNIGINTNLGKTVQAKHSTSVTHHFATSLKNVKTNQATPQGQINLSNPFLTQPQKRPVQRHIPTSVNQNNNTVQPLLGGLLLGGLAIAGAAAIYRYGIRRTGMARSSQVNTYSQEVANIHHNWNTLTPDVRRNRLVAAANRRLGVAGVPHIGVDNGAMNSSNHGAFSHQNWNMRLNPVNFQTDNISRNQFSDLADTVYHEARHSEQFYRIARRMAGQGHGVDHIVATTGMPERIVRHASANPINRFSVSRYRFETDSWRNSVFGAGRHARRQTLMRQHVDGALTDHHTDMITMYRDQINQLAPDVRRLASNIRRNPLSEHEQTQIQEFGQHLSLLNRDASDFTTQRRALMRRYKNPLLHQKQLREWRTEMTSIHADMQEAHGELLQHRQDLLDVIHQGRGTYDNYRGLPEETDAWSVGGRVARRVGQELNPHG